MLFKEGLGARVGNIIVITKVVTLLVANGSVVILVAAWSVDRDHADCSIGLTAKMD